MKGSITTDISNASVGFTKGWSWDDGAMEGSVSLTSESLSEGVEVTVTFKVTQVTE